jgi:hypothetical protein
MTDVTTHNVRKRRGNGTAREVTVSGRALAVHLDCSRSYIQQLEAEGVLHREDDGFPLDRSRVAYLRFLKRERKQSPRTEADTAFQQAKTALINIRIAEKKKVLMLASDHEAFVERLVGLFLTGLSGFAAQIGGRDMAKRRAVDQVVHGLRVQIAEAAGKLADETGEPPLESDA